MLNKISHKYINFVGLAYVYRLFDKAKRGNLMKDYVESIISFLAIFDIDIASIEDEPPKLIFKSSAANRAHVVLGGPF